MLPLENHLVAQFRHEDYWSHGLGTLDAVANFVGLGEITVQLQRGANDGFRLDVPRGRSNPANVRATQEFLERWKAELGPEISLTIRWRLWRVPARVSVSIYQSAYLLLFPTFGYEAVGNPHFWPIREFVQDPDAGGFQPRIMLLSEESAAPYLAGGQHTLAFLREPRAIVAFLRFVSEAGRPRVFAVVLPGLDAPELPLVNPERFRAAPIPYDPNALLVAPWYMRFMWDSYHQQPEDSPS